MSLPLKWALPILVHKIKLKRGENHGTQMDDILHCSLFDGTDERMRL